MLDLELDLVGLGNSRDQEEEEYIWVRPTRHGEIKLSTLQENEK